MSSEERQQILKMVEDGKISADEAMKLMKALDKSSVEMEIIETVPASSSGPEAESNSKKPSAPEFEEVARTRASTLANPIVDRCNDHCAFCLLDVHVSQYIQLWILVLLRVASTFIGDFDDCIVCKFPNISMVICECGTSGRGMAAEHHSWISDSAWIGKLVSPQLWKQH